jgi:hypothetical protein
MKRKTTITFMGTWQQVKLDIELWTRNSPDEVKNLQLAPTTFKITTTNYPVTPKHRTRVNSQTDLWPEEKTDVDQAIKWGLADTHAPGFEAKTRIMPETPLAEQPASTRKRARRKPQ